MEDQSHNITIPSNPKDREAIFQVIKDISDQWCKIEAYKSYIKEAVEGVAEKYEIPKKLVTQMARTYHAGVYSQKVGEFSDFQVLYESIVQQTDE